MRQHGESEVPWRAGETIPSTCGDWPTQTFESFNTVSSGTGYLRSRIGEDSVLAHLDCTFRAHFVGIAAIVALVFATAAAAAPIDDAQKTEVRISVGDAVLAATLYRPAGAQGDLPAVVVGHGSGKVTRKNTFWTNAALSTGLAALVYDKRGAGESTGTFMEWETKETPEMFQQLAMDMVHATRWLSDQQGIDRNRIGLMGGSQAGWIMPLAASQEPMIKFVIVGEGVPLPAVIEVVHGEYLDLVGDEANPTLRQVIGADALAMDYDDGPWGYDPAPVLETLTIPILWIFGLYDGVIPVRLSIDRIGQLQKAGKRNHSLHIFPFGDHNFDNVFTGDSYSVPEASRAWLRTAGLMDKEYLEELTTGTSEEHARIAWTKQIIAARVNPPKPPQASVKALAGRYAGGREIILRGGKLFYRRADGRERELIPLASDLFAIGEIDGATRIRFDRANGVVTGFAFVRIAEPEEKVVRQRP